MKFLKILKGSLPVKNILKILVPGLHNIAISRKIRVGVTIAFDHSFSKTKFSGYLPIFAK